MKVLIVGRTYPTMKSGSMGLFEYEQAKALSSENEVKYLFVDNQSIKKHRKFNSFFQTDNNIEISGKYFPSGGLPRSIYNYIKYKQFKKNFNKLYNENSQPDVVHFHYPLMTCNTNILNFLLKKKIKVVNTEHWSRVQKLEINNYQKEFYKLLAKKTSLISVSHSLKKSMENIIEFPVKIKVIPNFIDDSIFFIDKEKEVKNEFLSIGSLTKIKNTEFLLNTIFEKNIFNSTKKTFLRIIGDGPERKKLQEIINRYEAKNVEICGFMSKKNLNDELNCSKIYISTSSTETFGVPTIEAWYAGLPVLIPKSHPLACYVNEYNGAVYTDNDATDLIKKIEDVRNKTWNKQNIREQAIGIFSKKKVLESLNNIYRS